MVARPKVALIGLVALLSWGGLMAVVVFTTPEMELNRAGFFLFLFVALAASASLVAYRLSFRIYAMRRHQGDVGRALLQGGAPALFLTILVLLQSLQALNWWAVLPLAGMLVLVEILLRPRRAD